MRRVIMGAAGLTAILIASAALLRSSVNNSSELVVNTSASEHHSLKLVDVKACRDEVVAGQDSKLAASYSRLARQELARKADIVARYCMCKFAGAEVFMTEREMVTQWLSASATFSKPLPGDKGTKLDQIAENCAQQYGLGT
jgi:hypothetical protein